MCTAVHQQSKDYLTYISTKQYMIRCNFRCFITLHVNLEKHLKAMRGYRAIICEKRLVEVERDI
jgi:hypothetical protein